MISSLFRFGSRDGTAAKRASVYGWIGDLKRALFSAISTTFPKYITAIRSLM